MKTPWISRTQLEVALERNESFWKGKLTRGPLLWVTAPSYSPGIAPTPPPIEAEEWTDVAYVIAKAEYDLAKTHYAGDALPVHNPWLGPDQVAAWLGADITFAPRDNTSWVKPFVKNWNDHQKLVIDPMNRWWRLYLDILHASVERGADKWVTCYPDLHTGIDALAAIRGPENLMVDLIDCPETIKDRMKQMTKLWMEIVDIVSDVILFTGQGTSNWTYGWSSERFLCVGQNDFSALVSTEMFDEFIFEDTLACCNYVDHVIYHLDGPGALHHLPRLLSIDKIDCIQWIQGAGAPLPSKWLDLLRRIQDAGKSVQVMYGVDQCRSANFVNEIDALCSSLDNNRLFIVAMTDSLEKANLIVDRVQCYR